MKNNIYRSWDLDNHNMWYSHKDEDCGEGIIIWNINKEIYFTEPQIIDRCPGGHYHEQVIEYRKPNQVVMQYIGKEDNANQKIYEIDIIEAIDVIGNNILGVIEYNNEKTKYVVRTKYSYENLESLINIKVKGNVFQDKKIVENFYKEEIKNIVSQSTTAPKSK